MQNDNIATNGTEKPQLQWDNSAENMLNLISVVILIVGLLVAIGGGISTALLFRKSVPILLIIAGVAVVLSYTFAVWALLRVFSNISMGVKDLADKVESLEKTDHE